MGSHTHPGLTALTPLASSLSALLLPTCSTTVLEHYQDRELLRPRPTNNDELGLRIYLEPYLAHESDDLTNIDGTTAMSLPFTATPRYLFASSTPRYVFFSQLPYH